MTNLNKKTIDASVQQRAIDKVSNGELQENSKVFYNKILKMVQKRENEIGKYYYQFNYNEVMQMLKEWEITTVGSIKTVNTILNKYMDFYIDEGRIAERYTTRLRTDDLVNCIYDNNENLYFTSQEEYEMFVQSFCYNAQDCVAIALLFEGVKGLGNQELINLREEDCDFKTNTLTLRQDNRDGLEEVRTLQVSEATMSVVYDAIHDDIYFKGNGVTDGSNKTEQFPINRNGYVIRTAGGEDYNPIGIHVIQQRVKRITKLYGKEKLSPRNVFISGMMLMLKKTEAKKGELTNEDFKFVHKHHNLGSGSWHSTKRTFMDIGNSFTVRE